MKSMFMMAAGLLLCLMVLFLLYSSGTFRGTKMYNLAFRKKENGDFFHLNDDYCFEQYDVDLGGRYWLADPFLFEHNGRDYVFYEAYDLWSGKGKIGFSEIDPQAKKLTPPRIILDKPYHLSWPNVFELGGEIYMMPETCGDYRVRLFRAVNFPYDWEEHSILVNDIWACDSIIMNGSDGRAKYLLASEQYHNTPTGSYPSCYVKNILFTFSSGDSLRLEPEGSIDPQGTVTRRGDYGIRNAGQFFMSEGMLLRPGQDCRNKQYGRGVVFFRVDSLEPYSEHEVFSIDCGNIGPHLRQDYVKELIGLHTYNQSRNFEVIDFAGIRSTTLETRIASKLFTLWKMMRKLYRMI
ncbi:MAG: hypothetical protein IJG65_05000 [Synergistaceae bacterium]|nr:hypothetical protein [Synergistaceae bacterium]